MLPMQHMKAGITVHTNGNIYEVTKRTYIPHGSVLDGSFQIEVKKEILSFHTDLNKALAEMNKQIDALPDDEYLFANERRRAGRSV
jgi:hypothetical protein